MRPLDGSADRATRVPASFIPSNRSVRVKAEPAQSPRFFSTTLPCQQLTVPERGQGLQDLRGLAQVSAFREEACQLRGGGTVAGVGPGAQLLKPRRLASRSARRGGGVPVADVSQGAQDRQGSVQVCGHG